MQNTLNLTDSHLLFLRLRHRHARHQKFKSIQRLIHWTRCACCIMTNHWRFPEFDMLTIGFDQLWWTLIINLDHQVRCAGRKAWVMFFRDSCGWTINGEVCWTLFVSVLTPDPVCRSVEFCSWSVKWLCIDVHLFLETLVHDSRMQKWAATLPATPPGHL